MQILNLNIIVLETHSGFIHICLSMYYYIELGGKKVVSVRRLELYLFSRLIINFKVYLIYILLLWCTHWAKLKTRTVHYKFLLFLT